MKDKEIAKNKESRGRPELRRYTTDGAGNRDN